MKKSKLYYCFLAIFICGFVPRHTNAQIKCPDSLIFETYDFGDNQNTFYAALKFRMTSDSVYIINSMKNAKPDEFTAFKILKKECNWNSDFSEGESLLTLEIIDEGEKRQPSFTLSYKGRKGLIKLTYDNDNPIIFTVIKQ